MRRLLKAALAVLLVLPLAGCETLSYYMQAIGGQMSLMARAEPVDKLLSEPATPAALRERLLMARSIREFSVTALKLPDNSSYRSYAELERPHAVWNVVAAPEFSLEAMESCFPVAGCVAYRGFFSESAARRYAAEMRAGGRDVYLYGVPAYSTLGKLDDPLLSSFIRYPDAELARLLFHELAHQVVYAKDDSTFNESFAVSVERAGVQRWLAATGRTAQLQGIIEARERTEATMREFTAIRLELKALYGMPLAAEVMRSRKAELYAQLRKRIADNPRYAAIELNNAVLASFATYTQLVPAFEKILVDEGGDMERFYARVKALTPKGVRGFSPVPSPVPIAGGAGDGSPIPVTEPSSPDPSSTRRR